MRDPQPMRPTFPPGYVENAQTLLPWNHVEQRLTDAVNYWLCTVRPNSRPHAVPKWGVWLDDRIYFDGSPETRHARNLVANPHVVIHLESGSDVVIVEGTAREAARPSAELAQRIAQAYTAKYAALGYAPEPTTWDNGGLFEVMPHTVLAWTSFTDDPTKFVVVE